MKDLNKKNGKTITGIEWLEQQINDILTTRKGTRTMRANYGSNLPDLIDKNITNELVLDIIDEVNTALEPLANVFKVVLVEVVNNNEKLALNITGNYLQNNKEITLNTVFIN